MARRLCFITSTRADWGLLQPLAQTFASDPEVKLSIIATNMHLMEEFGHTVDEIIAAGLPVDVRVDMRVPGSDDASRARALAKCTAGMADALDELRPDAVVILGDRYEMLGAASAAAVMRIPIIHIAGGEISEGALDDSFRHAISKLSTLHLTATEAYRKRVIQMGEEPGRVINTGAIGVWNAMNVPLIPAGELLVDIGAEFGDRPIALVTYHPATNDSSSTPLEQARILLEALDSVPELACVITAPNNDAGGEPLVALFRDYACAHPDKAVFIASLGQRRYLSMLACAAMVVGNSSSGIVEVPSAGIPTVNIGCRQQGRIAGPSVIHCAADKDAIREAILLGLSDDMRALSGRRENPYYQPDTLNRMTGAIKAFLATLPCPPKHFYDLP